MANTPSQNPTEYDFLKGRLNGPLTEPWQSAYDKQRTPWLQVVDQYPLVIVNAANEQDIVEAIRFAREKQLHLVAQNTGHDVALPLIGGVLLRLSGMKSIDIDAANQTATVGPGVVAGEQLKEAKRHGLACPTGQVLNVGVIGYTLGGVGWLGRKLGAACQSVQSATVVLADGSVVTASVSENEDLFWALRSGGNFSVVTSLTVKLVPLEKVFGGTIYYRIKDSGEVLRFYRDWTSHLNDNTITVLRLMRVPPKPTFLMRFLTESCAIGVCHSDEATAGKLHDELIRFKTPVLDQLETPPYPDMGRFDEASDLDGSATYGDLETLKDLGDPVVDGLVDIANTRLPPLFMVELQHLEGALGLRRASDTAYAAPDAPFFLHAVTPAVKQSLPELAVATTAAFDSLGSAYTGHVSYNFLRGDQHDKVPAAFTADKYGRLQFLKNKFDPSNFFRLDLNIPPASSEQRRRATRN